MNKTSDLSSRTLTYQLAQTLSKNEIQAVSGGVGITSKITDSGPGGSIDIHID